MSVFKKRTYLQIYGTPPIVKQAAVCRQSYKKLLGKKLFDLLSSLDKDEFRRMRKMLQSPFFTTNERHLAFYDFLKKHYPEFPPKKLEKELLFKVFYPEKKNCNERLLRVLLREFTQIVEDYLILLATRKDDFQRKKQLTSIYGQRNLYEYYEKGTLQLLAELDDLPMLDMEQTRVYALLTRDYFHHTSTPKFANIDYLLQSQRAFDTYYVVEKLNGLCNFPIFERTLKQDLEKPFLAEVLQMASTLEKEAQQLVKLYYLIYQLLQTNEDADFEAAKDFFEAHIEVLPERDRKFIFYSLLNVAVTKSNRGLLNYSEKVFNFYKIGLKYKIIFENKFISGTTFINITISGLKINAFNWVKSYIEKYSNFIEKKERESAKDLSLGSYFFAVNNFDKVTNLLVDYKSKKINDVLGAKSLMLRSYFELVLKDVTYLQLYNSYAIAFDKFIRRQNISTSKQLRYKNLVSILTVILKRKTNMQFTKNYKQKILNDVKNDSNIAIKTWLINRINKL